MNKYIISEEQFDKLYDGNIKKREYDAIIELIEDRVCEILEELQKNKHATWDWYCYSNGNPDIENEGGFFDPNEYSEVIDFVGDICIHEHIMDEVNSCESFGIPTRWLWESNYLEECAKLKLNWEEDAKAKKEKAKAKREKAKKDREIAIQSIRTKLTKEELKHIKFK